MFLIPVIFILLLAVLNAFSNRRHQMDQAEISPPPTASKPEDDDAEETCSICLDSLITHDNFLGCLSTKCDHKFHTKCLIKWFKKKEDAQCPLCRTPVQHNDLVSFPEGARMLKVVKRRLRRFFNYFARLQEFLLQQQQNAIIAEEIDRLSTESEELERQSREIGRDLDQLDQWKEEILQSTDELQREALAQLYEDVRQRFEQMQQRREEFRHRLSRLRSMF